MGCLTRVEQPFEELQKQAGFHDLPEEQAAVLLTLRGLLGCGLLVHCAAIRHGVDYGVNR